MTGVRGAAATSRPTADLGRLLRLAAIDRFQERQTAAVHALLGGGTPPAPGRTPRAYALAHHFLEEAEYAARKRHPERFAWATTAPGRDLSPLDVDTHAGPVVLLAPRRDQLIRSPLSDTPYYLIDAGASRVDGRPRRLLMDGSAHIHRCGFTPLVGGHAAVICLLSHRQLNETLHSWSITRLPGTVFTDFTDEPAVLGRDIVHEAGHHWLNDALAATGVTIPGDVEFHSPWRQTRRPAFAFLHACWAFSLTVLYSARVMPHLDEPARSFLTAYLRQQDDLLACARADFHRAVGLVTHAGLRSRLIAVFHAALRA